MNTITDLPIELIYKIMVHSGHEFVKFSMLSKQFNAIFEAYKNQLAKDLVPPTDNPIDQEHFPNIYQIYRIINIGFLKAIYFEELELNSNTSKLTNEEQAIGLDFLRRHYDIKEDIDEDIYTAIEYNCVGVIDFLIKDATKNGTKLYTQYDYNNIIDPLSLAIICKHDDMFKYLLNITKQYNIDIEINIDNTVVIEMIENNRLDLIKYLIENGHANEFPIIDLSNDDFLYISLEKNNLEMFEYLLSLQDIFEIKFDNSYDIAKCYYHSFIDSNIGLEYINNIFNKYELIVDIVIVIEIILLDNRFDKASMETMLRFLEYNNHKDVFLENLSHFVERSIRMKKSRIFYQFLKDIGEDADSYFTNEKLFSK